MKIGDAFRKAVGALATNFGARYTDNVRPVVKGEVFFTLCDRNSGKIETRHVTNLVTLDASILLARLLKDSSEPTKGGYVLAVGTGNTGWNPMSPPAATNTQRALYAEISRKTFSNTTFVNSSGVPVAYPTNIVDFTTTFTESEAVGPLVEMGIIGGNISTNLSVKNPVSPPNGSYDPTVDLTTKETLCNYTTFAVLNKPATSTLQLTWRLTF